jgi:hypothetical protein
LFDIFHSRVIGTAVLIPFLSCCNMYYGLGDRIKGLVVGVVDNEVSSITDCFNSSLKTFEVQNSDCKLTKVSCDFIKEFDQSIAELVSCSKLNLRMMSSLQLLLLIRSSIQPSMKRSTMSSMPRSSGLFTSFQTSPSFSRCSTTKETKTTHLIMDLCRFTSIKVLITHR